MRFGILLALVLSISIYSSIVLGEENHAKEKSSSTTRPTEEKTKKGLSLQEKLSACLAERPGSSSEESTPTEKTQDQEKTWKAPQAKDGQALFEQNCFPCHSAGGTPGPISDWKRAAVRAGDDMPPSKKPIPAEDLAKLREFFGTKN